MLVKDVLSGVLIIAKVAAISMAITLLSIIAGVITGWTWLIVTSIVLGAVTLVLILFTYYAIIGSIALTDR